jgi:hypothetical protein
MTLAKDAERTRVTSSGSPDVLRLFLAASLRKPWRALLASNHRRGLYPSRPPPWPSRDSVGGDHRSRGQSGPRQSVWQAEVVGNAGAEQYVEHLFSRVIGLRPEAPGGEFSGLMQAANIAVTAYRAAGVFDHDEARQWRDRLADAVKRERAQADRS